MVDGVYYVQAGSPLWENSFYERGILSTDSSSFNLLSYDEDPEGKPFNLLHRLTVKSVSFSEGTQLIERIL